MSRRLFIPRFVHWSRVSAISNSTTVKSTILIPLIGYIVLFNEKLSAYLNLIGVLNGAENAYGVSFRLVSLYMGLCGVAVAVAIYAIRCPPEIKGYATAQEFITGVQNTLSGPSLRMYEVTIASDPHYTDEFEALRLVLRRSAAGDENEYNRGVLYLYFKLMDESRDFSRFCCLMMYAYGFAFISMPSFDVFVKVARIFVQMLLGAVRYQLANW